jgi:signal peptidase
MAAPPAQVKLRSATSTLAPSTQSKQRYVSNAALPPKQKKAAASRYKKEEDRFEDDEFDEDYDDDIYDDDYDLYEEEKHKSGNGFKTLLNLIMGDKSKPRKKKVDSKVKAADFLFYSGLLILVLSAFYYTSRSNGPFNFFSTSLMTMQQDTMKSMISKGSLIMVKEVKPSDLKVHDIITYMKDTRTAITHRIENIYPDYDGSGKLGFQTRGVENPSPDSSIVYEDSVIGKVVFHIPIIGGLFSYISSHFYIVFILFGLMMICSFALRGLITFDSEMLKLNGRKKKQKNRLKYS